MTLRNTWTPGTRGRRLRNMWTLRARAYPPAHAHPPECVRAAVLLTVDMATRARVRAPELIGKGGWLNTGDRQYTLADLRGRIVVLDFWTS